MATQQNSRLGQILLNKGLISADQLAQAIQLQASSHKRLGEILIEQGLVSERQLSKALKKQSSLRVAATLVAALQRGVRQKRSIGAAEVASSGREPRGFACNSGQDTHAAGADGHRRMQQERTATWLDRSSLVELPAAWR